jgi:hypothetical protein
MSPASNQHGANIKIESSSAMPTAMITTANLENQSPSVRIKKEASEMSILKKGDQNLNLLNSITMKNENSLTRAPDSSPKFSLASKELTFKQG